MKKAMDPFSRRQLQGQRILVTLSRDLSIDTGRHYKSTQSAPLEVAPA